MSILTHCSHVFLLLPRPLAPSTTNPLQADTQSSTPLRSRWPNHLNLPRLTTSATQLIPRRLHKSSLCLLSFKDTPHIHLTILCSVLSKLSRLLSSWFKKSLCPNSIAVQFYLGQEKSGTRSRSWPWVRFVDPKYKKSSLFNMCTSRDSKVWKKSVFLMSWHDVMKISQHHCLVLDFCDQGWSFLEKKIKDILLYAELVQWC